METRTLEPILKEHPFFGDLAPQYLQLIVGCARNVRFKAGQGVFHEGDTANYFYVIRRGRIRLEIHAPGRGSLAIQTIQAGEVVGWSWLFPPYRWHSDAYAVEDTQAIEMDGACLRSKCEADHDLGYEMMKRFSSIISDRLQATRLQLLDIYGAAKG